jgi:hypothetical protein
MHFPYSITVTVSHRAVNRDGDYTVTDSYRLPGCVISLMTKARSSTEQQTDERDTVTATTTLFAPVGSDIRDSDTITLDDGTVWHVWGIATSFSSPFTGWQPGMQVMLRLYRG